MSVEQEAVKKKMTTDILNKKQTNYPTIIPEPYMFKINPSISYIIL